MDSSSETQEEEERGHLPTECCALGYPRQDLKPGYLTSAPLCCLCLEIGPEF